MLHGLVVDLVRKARGGNITLPELGKAVRRQYVVDALEEYHCNQVRVAACMGLHRNTLRRMAAELDINVRVMRREMSVKKPVASVTVQQKERINCQK